jgi:hypothetical protein
MANDSDQNSLRRETGQAYLKRERYEAQTELLDRKAGSELEMAGEEEGARSEDDGFKELDEQLQKERKVPQEPKFLDDKQLEELHLLFDTPIEEIEAMRQQRDTYLR